MDNLTAVVPFWNGHATIERLLDSLPDGLPVIVVDDHSDEPLRLNRANVRVVRPQKKSYFSGAVNAGAEACQTDVLVLNQDVWFTNDGWLNALEKWRSKGYAVIGDGVVGHPAWPKGYVQGTFMYMSRQALQETGPLNVKDYPLWGATCEWQARACRKGFRVRILESLHHWMRHEERKRYGSAITEMLRRRPQDKARFIRTPPAISVIVPCYNYAHYLRDCINSLVGGPTSLGQMAGQTFQGFEVVIVDDCSPDDTPAVGQALADPWKGIRYIRLNRNKGTPGAINAGVRASFGKYITVLSADDMAESWHLEMLYRACESNPNVVPYTDVRIFKHGKRDQALRLPAYNFDELMYRNHMSAGIMYPRRAWQEAGGYPECMVYGREDWAFNVALGVHGWCGLHLDDPPGYLYRREKQNRSLRNTSPARHGVFLGQIQALFPEIYKGDYPMGCCGGNRPVKNTKNMKVGAPIPKGGPNMVEIEYLGVNPGTETYTGPVTGHKYTFSSLPRYRTNWVDERDLATGNSRKPGLLETTDKGRRLFRHSQPPNPQANLSGEEEARINPPEPPQIDDLTQIRGVGAARAEKLISAGFLTIKSVSKARPEVLSQALELSLSRAEQIIGAAIGAL